MLKTTIVGSLPSPPGSPSRSAARALASSKATRRRGPGRRGASGVAGPGGSRPGRASCDAEQRRRHYIWGFLEASPVSIGDLAATSCARRPLRRRHALGSIVRCLRAPKPVLLEAVRFARAHTRTQLKVTLPGPMTTVDSTIDEFYNADEKTLAMRFASDLTTEARELADAGADVIQFDEPCFNIYLDEVRRGASRRWSSAWTVWRRSRRSTSATATARRRAGLEEQNTDWGHYGVTLPLLARSNVDQVSVECAASGR